MIVLYAPIENLNKTLENFEKKKYKKISIYISIFIMIISIVAYYINIHLSAVITLTFFVIMIMMFVGLHDRKEGKWYEKDSEYHG